MFTDVSQYAWACVLTQAYTFALDGKEDIILTPIIYVSGFFRGSQLNWEALTKEAYIIYMSVKKLPFHLDALISF